MKLKIALVVILLFCWAFWGIIKTKEFKINQTKITNIDIFLLGPIVWIICLIIELQDLFDVINK